MIDTRFLKIIIHIAFPAKKKKNMVELKFMNKIINHFLAIVFNIFEF